MIITCKNPNCKAQFEVPGGQGKVMVACPKCKAKFMSDTGNVPDTPKPTPKKPKPTPEKPKPPKPAPEKPRPTPPVPPTPPTPAVKPDSKITFWRPGHAYKDMTMQGIGNMAEDKTAYYIFVDNVEQGLLKSDSILTVDISSLTGHILDVRRTGLKIRTGKVTIPAGGGSYSFTVFNKTLWGSPDNDPFGDAVVQFMVQTYGGKTIRSWLNDPNNRYGAVGFSFTQRGVRFYYPLNETKGLKQWASGNFEQELTFADIGIHLPFPAGAGEYGYWKHLEERVKDAVCSQLGFERYLSHLRPAHGPAYL